MTTALTPDQRSTIISQLTTNCDCWKHHEDRDLLANFSDDKLTGLATLAENAVRAESHALVVNAAVEGFVDATGNAYRVNPQTAAWERKVSGAKPTATATLVSNAEECPECGGDMDEDGECEECGYVENASASRTTSNANPEGINQYSKGAAKEAGKAAKEAGFGGKSSERDASDAALTASKAAHKTGSKEDHDAAATAHHKAANAYEQARKGTRVNEELSRSYGKAESKHRAASKAHDEASKATNNSIIPIQEIPSMTTPATANAAASPVTPTLNDTIAALAINGFKDESGSEFRFNPASMKWERKLATNDAAFMKKIHAEDEAEEEEEDGEDEEVKNKKSASGKFVKNKKPTKNADEEFEEEEEPEEDEEDETMEANAKKLNKASTTNKRAKTVTTPTTTNAAPATMEQWLAAAPPELQSIVSNALRSQNRERAALVATLNEIAAATQFPEKKTLIENKLKDNLNNDALQQLITLTREAAIQNSLLPQRGDPIYLGASVPDYATHNRRDDGFDKNAILPIPTINWAEEAAERRAAK